MECWCENRKEQTFLAKSQINSAVFSMTQEALGKIGQEINDHRKTEQTFFDFVPLYLWIRYCHQLQTHLLKP